MAKHPQDVCVSKNLLSVLTGTDYLCRRNRFDEEYDDCDVCIDFRQCYDIIKLNMPRDELQNACRFYTKRCAGNCQAGIEVPHLVGHHSQKFCISTYCQTPKPHMSCDCNRPTPTPLVIKMPEEPIYAKIYANPLVSLTAYRRKYSAYIDWLDRIGFREFCFVQNSQHQNMLMEHRAAAEELFEIFSGQRYLEHCAEETYARDRVEKNMLGLHGELMSKIRDELNLVWATQPSPRIASSKSALEAEVRKYSWNPALRGDQLTYLNACRWHLQRLTSTSSSMASVAAAQTESSDTTSVPEPKPSTKHLKGRKAWTRIQ